MILQMTSGLCFLVTALDGCGHAPWSCDMLFMGLGWLSSCLAPEELRLSSEGFEFAVGVMSDIWCGIFG